jgi:hypothetical protein
MVAMFGGVTVQALGVVWTCSNTAVDVLRHCGGVVSDPCQGSVFRLRTVHFSFPMLGAPQLQE